MTAYLDRVRQLTGDRPSLRVRPRSRFEPVEPDAEPPWERAATPIGASRTTAIGEDPEDRPDRQEPGRPRAERPLPSPVAVVAEGAGTPTGMPPAGFVDPVPSPVAPSLRDPVLRPPSGRDDPPRASSEEQHAGAERGLVHPVGVPPAYEPGSASLRHGTVSPGTGHGARVEGTGVAGRVPPAREGTGPAPVETTTDPTRGSVEQPASGPAGPERRYQIRMQAARPAPSGAEALPAPRRRPTGPVDPPGPTLTLPVAGELAADEPARVTTRTGPRGVEGAFVEGQPDVTVTIGRIDVRVGPPPAPATAPSDGGAATRPQPRRLNDYLQARTARRIG